MQRHKEGSPTSQGGSRVPRRKMGWWEEARLARFGLNPHRPLGFSFSHLEGGQSQCLSGGPCLCWTLPAQHSGAEWRPGAGSPGAAPKAAYSGEAEWVGSAFSLCLFSLHLIAQKPRISLAQNCSLAAGTLHSPVVPWQGSSGDSTPAIQSSD